MTTTTAPTTTDNEDDDDTIMYSYPYTPCRRGVVATFDLSAKILAVLKTHATMS